MNAPISTVLIVDDHDGYRRTARRMLEAAGYRVVAEARDAKEALAAVETARPDLVLLDVGLPDTDGMSVASEIAASDRPPVVILISSRDEAAYGARTRTCGAVGFVAKEELSSGAIGSLVGGR